MYELLYIVPGPLTEKDLPDVSKKVRGFIEKMGGGVVKEDNLGNRKLAYPIKGVYRGFYLLVNFDLKPESLKDLNKELRLSPEILRHLITRFVEAKTRPSRKKNRIKDNLESNENVEAGGERKEEKGEKIDLEKLGEKIDDLFKI